MDEALLDPEQAAAGRRLGGAARRALTFENRTRPRAPPPGPRQRESRVSQLLALSVPVIILSMMIAIRGVSFGHLLLPKSLSPALEAAGAQHAGATLFILSTAIGQLFFVQHSGVPFASSGAAFELLPLFAGICARVLAHPEVHPGQHSHSRCVPCFATTASLTSDSCRWARRRQCLLRSRRPSSPSQPAPW
jgi:hypothetical protein